MRIPIKTKLRHYYYKHKLYSIIKINMKRPNIAELNIIQKLEVELIILFLIILIGSVWLMYVEHINYFDAVYFSIITLASIWYWDIVPHTIAGKIITMIYALIWLPLFITMWYLISSLLLQPIKKTKKRMFSTQLEQEYIAHNNKL